MMQRSKRRELNKLRELAWFLLIEKHCCFCEQAFLYGLEANVIAFGNATAPALPVGMQISIHHVDENHENNFPGNLALAHTSCHKRFHLLKRNLYLWAQGVKQKSITKGANENARRNTRSYTKSGSCEATKMFDN
jgi:hypothetical protein